MGSRHIMAALLLLFCISVKAQNFSGLQNKRLNKSEDIGSLLESGLGALFGGKLRGEIDSVVVTHDAEKRLRVKVYYTGYENGFFTVTCLGADRQRQREFTLSRFAHPGKPSPAECTIDMEASVPPNRQLETQYLRIDVAKKENGLGNISVFLLNKKWQSTVENRNIVIEVPLAPVGKAASLTNERRDITPSRTIQFDPKLIYNIKPDAIKNQRIRTLPGGNRVGMVYNYRGLDWGEISGTWNNTDNNTSGITRLVITNDNQLQAYGKCAPQDCDWGKVTLSNLGGNRFRAVYDISFVTRTLNFSLGTDGLLTLNETDIYKDGRPNRTYSYTFRKNVMLVRPATRIYTLNQMSVLTPPAGGQVDRNPKGPDKNVQIYLLDGLSADVDFRRPQDISNININVFADKNLNSGIYYILPADYHLKWETKSEPEKGYDFRILYGKQGDGADETNTDAPVRMSATLTAGISTRERNFVKELLRSVRPDFKDLRYLPLRDNPQFTFQSTLGAQYNIPEAKITVEKITDLTNDIRVAWQTDADTKEFIQTALTSREGIAASVILKPEDEDILDQQIPAGINLADIRTLGKMNLEPNAWRNQPWRNLTPYPLRLRYIHVLKKEIGGNKPIIYSWSLNDVVIPSQAQANFQHSRIPAWIDNEASTVLWVEYGIEDCPGCDQKVLDAVTGGVSGARAQQLKFTIPPNVFDTLNASYFMITVRTRQADPKGLELKEFPGLKITPDATKEFSVGPVYVPADGALAFEYKITVASKDGDFYPSNEWIPGTEREVLLGRTRLKTLFKGIIPGIE